MEHFKMTTLPRTTIRAGLALLPACMLFAQLGTFNREMRLDLTREWKGERFEDARPKVPDSILQRMAEVSHEEAWAVLRAAHYDSQFEGNWKQIVTVPGKRLVGRAVTAVFMPIRPDVNAAINEHGKAEGRGQSGGQNSWVIDTLKPGDVLIVDLFGKIADGTFIGDNLGTSIYAKSGTGVVVDGAVRDVSGISEIKGFTGFVRGFHPSALKDVMLVGINVPIRIGRTTVMPGDIVLGDSEGITFIPPHLSQKVVESSEEVRMRDEWGHQMLREGKYMPGQIDSKWTPAMEREFGRWLEQEKTKRKQ
jgi:4-hydroxy-4-methyl-2-oxoglutarate aldolase